MKSLGVLDEFETKLSSAGLVYAHYGRKVIAAILELPEDDPTVALLYRKLYEGFVESVDAIDNGVPQFDGVPRYGWAAEYELACVEQLPAEQETVSMSD